MLHLSVPLELGQYIQGECTMRAINWTAVAAITVCLSLTTWADDGGRGNGNRNQGNNGNANVATNGSSGFESGLIGSVPNSTIGGIASGGVPWVVAQGESSITADGQMRVRVSGLLIASGAGVSANLVGTVGPVMMVAASLVCGGSGGSVVASSDGAYLSVGGNAEIDTTIPLPATCIAPAVLVRIFTPTAPTGSQLGRFIAVSGFTAANNSNNYYDHDN
jgi:hypothetical protein